MRASASLAIGAETGLDNEATAPQVSPAAGQRDRCVTCDSHGLQHIAQLCPVNPRRHVNPPHCQSRWVIVVKLRVAASARPSEPLPGH